MSFGYQQVAWFKQSASYGSTEDVGTDPRFILPVKPSITVEKTLARIKTEHLRGNAAVQPEEDQLGIESVAGSLSGVVPWKGDLYFLLKNTLGKVVTAGVAAPFTRTYTWVDNLFYGFSVGINRAGANYAYRGCQIASLKLAATIGGPLEWTADLLGQKEDVVATKTPATLPSLHAVPYMLFQQATFEIDDVVEPITSFELTFTNELESAEDRSYALGSATRVALARSGYGVSGTIKRRHDLDATTVSKFYAKFLSGATAKLEIILTHPTDPTNYSGVITLGLCKFEGKTPTAADRGFLSEEIPFTAYSLDLSSSSIVIKDANATPAAGTETGAYDGAGA